MRRREFLGAIPLGAGLLAQSVHAAGQVRIEPFNYAGVRLRESRWRGGVEGARESYLTRPDDDLLQGFRRAAGLRAPGSPRGGWCGEDSSTVFGQWLSGLARLYRATGDTPVRDKAARLM